MTLYKGPPVSSLFSSIHLGWTSLFQIPNLVSESMKVGPLLLLGSCVLWSSWIIMQAETARFYPAQMSITALMCFLATIQSTIATLIFEHDPADWKVEWNLELLSVTYTGIVCSGITFYFSTWVIHKKGPVFMSMFNPLVTVIVALLGTKILHESLHVGSAGGAVLIVGGLYCLLWGKGQDREEKKVKAKGKEALGVNQTEEVQSKTNSNKYIDIEEPLLGTS
ncbi:WAT1-related protein At4g08290-like [Cryptomeria japonica]|uniref:WAT1-related protein At4g08290-like n=1 Tax=Cryptomeria japonica TaxID=3369 RepID=UPI0027DA7745|nr:WAT1-related protein At4g08290-like [Cryptomeria japonica]